MSAGSSSATHIGTAGVIEFRAGHDPGSVAGGDPAAQLGLRQHEAGDRRVLFAEDFESGGIEALKQRWDEISNQAGKVVSFSDDVPAASGGKRTGVGPSRRYWGSSISGRATLATT